MEYMALNPNKLRPAPLPASEKDLQVTSTSFIDKVRRFTGTPPISLGLIGDALIGRRAMMGLHMAEQLPSRGLEELYRKAMKKTDDAVIDFGMSKSTEEREQNKKAWEDAKREEAKLAEEALKAARKGR